MKCFYGCGNEATTQIKNGNWICSKSPNQCEVNKKKNSDKLKLLYKEGKKDCSHLDGKRGWSKEKILKEENEIFSVNLLATGYVKNALITLKKIKYNCDKCGIYNWNGKEISLELDHINGNSRDNRLKNLRLLCPNCHSQTNTFRGRNINTGKRKYTDTELKLAVKNCNNIRQVCIILNIAAKGGNYISIKSRMKKLNLSF